MTFQATIQNEVRTVGVGLHSGNLVTMTLKPAPPNTGIVFVRTDLNGAYVKASIEHIDFSMLQLATTLRSGRALVQTTEHLLSAAMGSAIDNLIVELDGAEVPIMDGSATPFLMLLEEAGRREQAVAAQVLRVTKPFFFEKDGKKVWVTPASDMRVSYEIRFDHPLIQRQRKTLVVNAAAYSGQVAPARTFGFLRDLNYLRGQGLIKGGSVDNAIVLDSDHMLNESLRLKDEFVSHKILDMIGDLAMAGTRLEGHFQGYKAGHEMHALFLQALLENEDCYEMVRGDVAAESPVFATSMVEVPVPA
ncbi:UDP-3-O-acyl-N-acetylglucosamine deacetylase [Acanthopleuribacter pedis]|uniref:UDP-3-O-acyl-N-acetylglucosamine deacetylase n=1 Tax=Acanthopleuribacter pedis TaxID=442870 RepID=A0A8J7QMK8_9BACT|nr:UDP-3-O-acyl-N-acetylglucosamine deacetylase [Acanthopleuribacter pedis]MBO1321158.1 UDP-3-O-[3-hydroxymyristoyl] N-acetylglucosamine deacetylase [Acanthopleuribacter pedis]